MQANGQSVINPKFVTKPVKYDSDDPAIWVNKQNPSESLVIGTDKGSDTDGALYVYDLTGKTKTVIRNLKHPNNVDVAYGMILQGKSKDLVVTTERKSRKLRVFSAPDMNPIDKGGIALFAGETGSGSEPMGIALYERASDRKIYAIVSRKSGPTNGTYLWQYLLEDDGSGNVKGTLVRRFGNYSGTQEIESVAIDDELGYVYCSDERRGVRKYYADPEKGNKELALFANKGFARDQEGISIYKIDDGTGYILVSDQGADEFHIYSREGTATNPHSHKLLKVVKVRADASDGSEMINYNLSPQFPKGLFVAMSTDKTFHFYRWEDIAGTSLKIRPSNIRNIKAPVLAAPLHRATRVSTAPKLTWVASEGAGSYHVQVAAASDFKSIIYEQGGLTKTTLPIKGLTEGKTYFWRVRALNGINNSSWSVSWSFTTIDKTAPRVYSINRQSPISEITGAKTVSFRATFSEVVTNVGVTDFIPVFKDNVTGNIVSVSAVGASRTLYDITIANITGKGTIRLDLKNTETGIADAAGNSISSGFSSGQLYRIQPVPPTITINSPTNNISFTAPATITLKATASDSDGAVAKVEFFSGAIKLGEDVTSPYSYTWNNVGAGKYTVSTIATDNSGLRSTSKAISITVLTSITYQLTNRIAGSAGDSVVHVNENSSTSIATPDKSLTEPEEQDLELYSYPNPFVEKVKISFTSAESQPLSLFIYDMKGRLVTTLFQGQVDEKTSYTFEWAPNLEHASGIYILKLQASNYSQNRKIVLNK
ncbi:phytase [Pontibacter pudoricolor]|uniref:phytase n=1 Tax=Pontibacter pudoricolor TaxID=2694930 RepID=UPI001391264E|nr:phytase [Pontibacter pudoricolor]